MGALAPLLARGIDAGTLEYFGVVPVARYGHPYAQYPVYRAGKRIAWRYKALSSEAPRKYDWSRPVKPEAASALYHAEGVQRGKRTYLFEGEADVWLATTLGIAGFSFLCGAGSCPTAAVLDLQAADPWHILVCYDNDKAGRHGSLSVVGKLRSVGLAADALDLSASGIGEHGDFTDLYLSCGRNRDALLDTLGSLPHLPPPLPRHQQRHALDRASDADNAAQLILLAERLTRLKRAGAAYVGRCPFHEDRTPSFYVYLDGHFHCFGCQAHGGLERFRSLMRERRLV